MGSVIDSMDRFETIINEIDEAFAHHKIIVDENNRPIDYVFLDMNEAFEKMTGLKREEIIDKRVKDIMPDIESYWIDIYGEIALTGKKKKFINYSSEIDKYFQVNVFSDRMYEFTTIFIETTDIRKVKALKQKYQLLDDCSRDIILFIEDNGVILGANKAAVYNYGYEHSELIGININQLRETNENELVQEQLKIAIRDGINFETMHKRKNGELFPVEVNSQKGFIEDEPILVSVIRDITDRKQLENELLNRANFDYLTGIYNRRFAMSTLDLEIKRENNKLALIYFDIDNFKVINDLYGHEWGDYLLKEITKRIEAIIRSSDVFARVGGDEFVILQVFKDNEYILLLDRIMKAMHQSFFVDNEKLGITLSIGVSFYPDDGKDKDELLAKADDSMYEAKKIVGNAYLIYENRKNKI